MLHLLPDGQHDQYAHCSYCSVVLRIFTLTDGAHLVNGSSCHRG